MMQVHIQNDGPVTIEIESPIINSVKTYEHSGNVEEWKWNKAVWIDTFVSLNLRFLYIRRMPKGLRDRNNC